ncbi:MAG: hypothetical protein E7666_00250 [Ruminococcaceae bacterium]|nr:hypothetical protein [Oscillospiraceae bacterium]
MLCESCKKRTATVFYNENINGRARSFSLCGECAAKLREKGDLQDVTSMLGSFADPFSNLHDNLFGGFFGIPSAKINSVEKKCPECGAGYSEIAKSGKVGCPTCYTIFRDELARTLQSIHGTTQHTGHVPARHRAKQAREEQLQTLRESLRNAIEKEDYESAAKLRDEIRALNEKNEKEGD